MPRRSNKREYAKNYFEKNKKDFKENPPEIGNWVIMAIGSDRYSYKIIKVAEDKKFVTVENGGTFSINKWYFWLPSDRNTNGRICEDHLYYYISKTDMAYRDPHF